MRYRSWIVPALLVLVGAVSHGTALAEESPDYDVLTYRLAITIGFEESPGPDSRFRNLFSPINKLAGEATIRVRNTSDQPMARISLVLHRLMKATAVESMGQQLTFSQVLRGLENWESLQVNHLVARWKEPLKPGAEAVLSVHYSGQLVGYPESGMLYVQETLDPDFTILRYETFCYPQVTPPEENAVSAARRFDTFDQQLEITVPDSHVVVTGGRSTGVTDTGDGSKTYSFESYEPEGIFMIPIAPYRVATTGTHRIFHFERSSAGVETLKVNLERAMALYTSWFGPPTQARGLTIAEIPEFFGSQSGAFILQTSGAFNNPEQYAEFYHELSHLWNPRDIDPHPCRWNEGLATFLEGLTEDHLGGQGNLDRRLETIFSSMNTKLEKDERLRSIAMIDYGKHDMTGYSYSVGALFFGVLHDVFGESSLLRFVRTYSTDNRKPGSSDSAFAEAIVSAFGVEAAPIVDEWFITSAFVDKIEGLESWEKVKEAYR